MQLSGEDTLKLNVLLHNDIQAIRIHESSMTLYALSASGDEAQVTLNPNCRPEQYLKRVREMLSGHVLGSPGGYPVFLKRWTRMGQARDESLADLLMLGEPEAVVAVANAPGLTDELARRAWWADPTSDIARRMLTKENVVHGAMGKVLAEHLVEHLAFETEPAIQIETVRLVLQPGLIDEAARKKLWASGARKNTPRVGFLQATPDDLPEPQPARADHAGTAETLASIVDHNPLARLLVHVLSGKGQGFLHTAENILRKPANQDVVVILLNTIGNYFINARTETDLIEDRRSGRSRDVHALIDACRQSRDDADNPLVAEVLTAAPGLGDELLALMVLGRVTDDVVTPIFAQTTAEGTLMRRKLEPVIAPLLEQIAVLRGQ